jgi:hypothetical protein
MLSSLSRFRGVATVLLGKVRDLRQLLSVGDAIQATTSSNFKCRIKKQWLLQKHNPGAN